MFRSRNLLTFCVILLFSFFAFHSVAYVQTIDSGSIDTELIETQPAETEPEIHDSLNEEIINKESDDQETIQKDPISEKSEMEKQIVKESTDNKQIDENSADDQNIDEKSTDLEFIDDKESESEQNNNSTEKLQVYALKQPVSVYATPSRDAKVLRTYDYGNQLKVTVYTNDWYAATIYVNGIYHIGYINKNDVGDLTVAKQVRGIALKTTNVYTSTDQKSQILKSYKKGSILKYKIHIKDWYEAIVFVNGNRHKGYIYAKDVETTVTDQVQLKGIGVGKPTVVYSSPSSDSSALKSYQPGQQLKFRSLSKNWYEATVFINGKGKTGYISAKDVELINDEQRNLNGIGIRQPTRVYSSASKDSKVLKNYKQGQILKFTPFTQNWYKATVYISGKARIGYLSANDIELLSGEKQTKKGVGIKQAVKVYSLASEDSKVLKSYKYGHILKFETFSKDWYKAAVYINGKRQIGYISKNDVNTNLNENLIGYAVKKSINVYSDTSRNSIVLKTYNKGKLLKYRPYNQHWFKATVYVNGKARSGYISTSDVSPHEPTLQGYAIKNPTYIYSKNSRNSSKLKSYKKGHLLKFKLFNNSWYKATVYVKGKAHTGYIHVNDVSEMSGEKDRGYDIPILMYHQIGDSSNSEEYGRFVSAENFEEQMKYLKSAGYTPIHFDEFHHIKNIEKPIIITFDDGYENNYIAYEILKKIEDKKFKPKATFFIIGSKIDKNHYLSSEQIREMSDSGIISIQSHTMTHPVFNDFANSNKIEVLFELQGSQKLLEDLTGKKVHTLAYPYGSYNEDVLKETKKYYDFAVTTKYGIANTNDSPYELIRVRVRYDTSIEEFKKIIVK